MTKDSLQFYTLKMVLFASSVLCVLQHLVQILLCFELVFRIDSQGAAASDFVVYMQVGHSIGAYMAIEILKKFPSQVGNLCIEIRLASC